MDKELYNLCKRVSKLFPEWETDNYWETYLDMDGEMTTRSWPTKRFSTAEYVPIYTSDLLLEKLPMGISLYKGSRGYNIHVGNSIQHSVKVYEIIQSKGYLSNTPLKALLKLTLKLHEEKVL